MRAIVTGGAGFIGSHLVDVLVAAGDAVTVVDRSGIEKNLTSALERGARLVQADVTEARAMRALFAEVRPEVVFHLAAQVDVRSSVEDPAMDARQNVGGTASVLTAAHASGARRLLLASTAAVYGDPAAERLPIAEEEPIAPLSPYGASKAAAESYLALFSRLYGLSTLALRMANVYGPRQDPHGEGGVIAIWCSAAAEGRPATVFGDGSQTRDFVYVEDVVRGFAAAANSADEGAINLSTGVETSLTVLAAALELDASRGPDRVGEIARSSLDPSVAAARLGWSAETPLAEGLRRTLVAIAADARR